MGSFNNSRRAQESKKETKKAREGETRKYLIDGIAALLTLGKDSDAQPRQGER